MNKLQINLLVRFKNKTFWVAFIPAFLILIQAVCAVFDINLDFSVLQSKLLDVVNAVFVLLAILGIVVDPTTKGVSDSKGAMNYDKPREDFTMEV